VIELPCVSVFLYMCVVVVVVVVVVDNFSKAGLCGVNEKCK
jgi:hypothetical protein